MSSIKGYVIDGGSMMPSQARRRAVCSVMIGSCGHPLSRKTILEALPDRRPGPEQPGLPQRQQGQQHQPGIGVVRQIRVHPMQPAAPPHPAGCCSTACRRGRFVTSTGAAGLPGLGRITNCRRQRAANDSKSASLHATTSTAGSGARSAVPRSAAPRRGRCSGQSARLPPPRAGRPARTPGGAYYHPRRFGFLASVSQLSRIFAHYSIRAETFCDRPCAGPLVCQVLCPRRPSPSRTDGIPTVVPLLRDIDGTRVGTSPPVFTPSPQTANTVGALPSTPTAISPTTSPVIR